VSSTGVGKCRLGFPFRGFSTNTLKCISGFRLIDHRPVTQRSRNVSFPCSRLTHRRCVSHRTFVMSLRVIGRRHAEVAAVRYERLERSLSWRRWRGGFLRGVSLGPLAAFAQLCCSCTRDRGLPSSRASLWHCCWSSRPSAARYMAACSLLGGGGGILTDGIASAHQRNPRPRTGLITDHSTRTAEGLNTGKLI